MAIAEISVIIPVFNGAKYLSAAIESVLEQAMKSIEIIVVNDGSTDATANVAAKLGSRIRYVEQDNKGPSAARNHGLGIAVGEYIAFLDCDDCWTPDNLKILKDQLDQDPQLDIVMGSIQAQRYDSAQNRYVSIGKPVFSQSLVAMLTRKRVFDKVGLLDESIFIGEDKDWFIRAVELELQIRCLQEHVSALYRRHDRNITRNMASSESYWLALMRKSLQRRKIFKA